ncbi:NOT2 / NOT3 / NOT5 family domain-containing protein [Ditylenchus destructor]|uniref:NOT2 / NOT3 / NOT5 family domain-containing protein n=1 Tax=Ditylenchus destructor TaxID=166010 RepID=A0AAD4MRN1_9BILA|nr:NOT2 / NOT3 / NOT5 family domain-containing protein [Ditylenchus destructor]
MSEKRKMLTEMEKCFKKVNESFEVFDELVTKMNETNSDNRQDKFQGELKEEIKKLQRLRDQIKTWCSSTEIKEKDTLLGYRRKIEERMELFKEIERRNKTKPYSKQGLTIEDVPDPEEKEKSDMIKWLKHQIRALNDEIDRTESKIEVLTNTADNTSRKQQKREDALEEERLKKHLERIKFHLLNWEVIMRMIINDKLEIKDVNEKLRDPIDMYVEALDPESGIVLEEVDPEDIYIDLDLASFIPQLTVSTSALLNDDDIKTCVSSMTPSTQPEVPLSKVSPVSSQRLTPVTVINETPKGKSADTVYIKTCVSSVTPSMQPEVPPSKVSPVSSQHLTPVTVINETPKGKTVNTEKNENLWNNYRKIELQREPKKENSPKETEKANNRRESIEKTIPSVTVLTEKTKEEAIEPAVTLSMTEWRGAYSVCDGFYTKEMEEQLRMLDSNITHLPRSIDSDPLRAFLKKTPCDTPTYYPQMPHPKLDALEYYLKLSPETLFFIFYYSEGTRAQMLASRALKKLFWRFHTKYLMWFQRHEEPTVITEEFEQGPYIYFDFEKWAVRKKDNFTFEYKFLEDRDVPI